MTPMTRTAKCTRCERSSRTKRMAMEPVNRREFLATAALAPLLQTAGSAGAVFVCMHQATSDRFDFKTAMEGYAKAGIRAVEPNLMKVREFAQAESPAAAKRLLEDLGLRP